MLFLILLCTLIVPRASWSEHAAGHEELSSANVVHTHHGSHVHEHENEHEDADLVANEADGDPSEDQDGLTHEHSPSIALGSALMLPAEIELMAVDLVRSRHLVAKYGGVPLPRPESLLRPPRTA
jgi:hypothetical protein